MYHGIFFSSSHFISQFPPMRFPLITAIRMCHLLPVHHLGMAFLAGSKGQNTTLADIRKAFLMIILNSEKDKNRFCFFLKEGDKIICFRYSTLIFGFNTSPFILLYVLRHHAQQFPDDPCTQILKNNFTWTIYVKLAIPQRNCIVYTRKQ